MKEPILAYIKKNRVSSTEIADCLGKRGAILDLHAVNRGHFRAGNVFWAYAHGGSNWDAHEQLQNVREGDVVLVEAFNCGRRAIFGDLVSKYLILYRQAAAIVVMGRLRDAPRLIKENWPIWCQGFNPVGCTNEKRKRPLDSGVIARRRKQYHGSIAVCDDTGVVIIPRAFHTKDFYAKLEFIEEQESTWYDCIDRLKYSTFETVCLKKYHRSGRPSRSAPGLP